MSTIVIFIIVLLVIILLAGGGYYYYKQKQEAGKGVPLGLPTVASETAPTTAPIVPLTRPPGYPPNQPWPPKRPPDWPQNLQWPPSNFDGNKYFSEMYKCYDRGILNKFEQKTTMRESGQQLGQMCANIAQSYDATYVTYHDSDSKDNRNNLNMCYFTKNPNPEFDEKYEKIDPMDCFGKDNKNVFVVKVYDKTKLKDTLSPNNKLVYGDILRFPNENFKLQINGMGTIAIVKNSGEIAWQSKINDEKIKDVKPNFNYYLLMQNDGNLVIYNKDNVQIWSSNTFSPESKLVLTDEGQLKIFDKVNNMIWSSHATKDKPEAKQEIKPEEISTMAPATSTATATARATGSATTPTPPKPTEKPEVKPQQPPAVSSEKPVGRTGPTGGR